MYVTITGARPYRVRTAQTLKQYEAIIARLRYRLREGDVGADVEELKKNGVDPDFVSYAIRHGFLRVLEGES